MGTIHTIHTCRYLFLLTLYLGNVVLVCLGRKGHRSHGHHDWLVGGINRSRGGLWARPNGGVIGREGGPCCLHLSPVEELWRKSKKWGLSRNRVRREPSQCWHKTDHLRTSCCVCQAVYSNHEASEFALNWQSYIQTLEQQWSQMLDELYQFCSSNRHKET